MRTRWTSLKFVPVTVTTVPPVSGPLIDDRDVTVGAGRKVKSLPAPAVGLVPADVMTVTSTVPTPPSGGWASISVSLMTSNQSASWSPNITSSTLSKFSPVRITESLDDPRLGDTEVTTGPLM